MKNNPAFYRLLACLQGREDGCTISWDGTRTPSNGFMVSCVPHLETHIDPASPTAVAELTEWFLRAAPHARRFGLYFGAWMEPGRGICLDLSARVGTERNAMRVARKHDQRAVFDVAAGRVIAVEPVPV